MTAEAYLLKVPAEFRATAEELHAFISQRLEKHPVTVKTSGMIGYGKGTDGFMLIGLGVRSGGVMLYASADVLTDHAEELGKKRTGSTYLRLHSLSEVKTETLDDIVRRSLDKEHMNYG